MRAQLACLGLARAALSFWRARVALAGLLLATLACCANALTDHLGYALSLVLAAVGSLSGALLGSAVARAAAQRAAKGTHEPIASSALSLVAGALSVGAVLVAALLVLLRSLVGTSCSPLVGAAFVALVASPGPLLASQLALSTTALVSRRRVASWLLALAPPVATALASLWRFYDSPAVFSYDPFFGFYPGALYDERITLDATLVSYRLGTLGWIVAAIGAFGAFFQRETGTVRARARPRIVASSAALAGLLVGVGVYAAGEALGHRHSAGDVARVLGGRVEGGRCTVLYARSIDARDALRTRDDCVLRLAQLEAFFGVAEGRPVTVYLFANAEQKRQLMGAAETYIAKPWRREVYLQRAAFPHPVLKHELAHVVTGAMGAWPFFVTARARVYPLPGLIEGAAVAAAWEGESDASPHEWSRAMLELGLLPRVEQLLGQGFYLHAAGSAYTAAGSFSRWLIETRGAARFRDVYRDGDFARAYGRSTRALDGEWRAYLRAQVPLSSATSARARARFARAPLHRRACPHETASLHEEARAVLDAGELSAASRALSEVVRRDPTETSARVELAEALVRANQPQALARLLDESARALGPAAVARLRVRVADVVWRWSGADAARALYTATEPELFDEDEARTLEVKRWAVGADGTSEAPSAWIGEAVRELLVGREALDPEVLGAVVTLEPRAGEGDASSALASYLVARQLVRVERYAQARVLLTDGVEQRLVSARLRAECRRLRAVIAFETGDRAGAERQFRALAADETRPRGTRDVALDWADRAARERARVAPAGP